MCNKAEIYTHNPTQVHASARLDPVLSNRFDIACCHMAARQKCNFLMLASHQNAVA